MSLLPNQGYSPILANLQPANVAIEKDAYGDAARGFAQAASNIAQGIAGVQTDIAKAQNAKAMGEYELAVSALDEAVANEDINTVELERHLNQLNKKYATRLDASDRTAILNTRSNLKRKISLEDTYQTKVQDANIEIMKGQANKYAELFPTLALNMSTEERAQAMDEFTVESAKVIEYLRTADDISKLPEEQQTEIFKVFSKDLYSRLDRVNKSDDAFLSVGDWAGGQREYTNALIKEGFDPRQASYIADISYEPLRNIEEAYGKNIEARKKTLLDIIAVNQAKEKEMIDLLGLIAPVDGKARDTLLEYAYLKGEAKGLGKTEGGEFKWNKAAIFSSVASSLAKDGKVRTTLANGQTAYVVPTITPSSYKLGWVRANSASPSDDPLTQAMGMTAMGALNAQNKVAITEQQGASDADVANALKNKSREDIINIAKNSKGLYDMSLQYVSAYKATNKPEVQQAVKDHSTEALKLYLMSGLKKLENDLQTSTLFENDWWIRVVDGKVRVFEKDTWRNVRAGKKMITDANGSQWFDITDERGLLGIGEGPQTVFRASAAELERSGTALINAGIMSQEDFNALLENTVDQMYPEGGYGTKNTVLETALGVGGAIEKGFQYASGAKAAEWVASKFVDRSEKDRKGTLRDTILTPEEQDKVMNILGLFSASFTPTPKEREGVLQIGWGTPVDFFQTPEGRKAAPVLAPEFWERFSKDPYDLEINQGEAMNIKWFELHQAGVLEGSPTTLDRIKKGLTQPAEVFGDVVEAGVGAPGKALFTLGTEIGESTAKTSIRKDQEALELTNPGNIKASKANAWEGKTGQTYEKKGSKFETFESPEMGFRAMFKLLETYQNKYGADTIEKIIGKWDNGNKKYIKDLEQTTNITKDEPVDLANKEQMVELAYKMSLIEKGYKQWKKYSREQVEAGYDLAFPERYFVPRY